MSNKLGVSIQLTIFGQSHAPGLGCVIEGLPAGVTFDWSAVGRFMDRRAPGRSDLATTRRESDRPEIISGLNEAGETCGAPLCAVIRNENQRSGDYDALRDRPRPGHADYPAYVRFGGHADVRGGGAFSGRLTAPLCFAGALCMQLLAKKGVFVGSRVAAIGGERDAAVDATALTREKLAALSDMDLPVIDQAAGERMRAAIHAARAASDSVGGIVEAYALGMPAGIGEPMFGGVENRLSQAIFGIPGVRGVEFGAGFAAADMRGSAHNDPYYWDQGAVRTRGDDHGGVLGGLTTGMPIVLRAAFKPTASIGLEQDTISLSKGENARLTVGGRHDPCIVPRAVPCVEAATAFVLCDMLAERGLI